MVETIDDIASGSITSYAQDESKVVKVRKLNKADGIIDWHQPAVNIYNRIRAFDPWPGVAAHCPLARFYRYGKRSVSMERVCPGKYWTMR